MELVNILISFAALILVFYISIIPCEEQKIEKFNIHDVLEQRLDELKEQTADYLKNKMKINDLKEMISEINNKVSTGKKLLYNTNGEIFP